MLQNVPTKIVTNYSKNSNGLKKIIGTNFLQEDSCSNFLLIIRINMGTLDTKGRC